MGSGIVIVTPFGEPVTIRAARGPVWRTVLIVPKRPKTEQELEAKAKEEDGLLAEFWGRWGDAILACGSAGAAGAAIYLSGGTATLVVGTFAVNSAALCGIQVGKGIEHDFWDEWEKSGLTSVKVWMSVETAMEFVDLFGGVKGAVGAIKGWKRAGQIEKVKKGLSKASLTRKQIVNEIRRVDPDFKPRFNVKAKKGAEGFINRADLRTAGARTLASYKSQVLANNLADALTVSGAGSTRDKTKDLLKMFDILVVDKPANPAARP